MEEAHRRTLCVCTGAMTQDARCYRSADGSGVHRRRRPQTSDDVSYERGCSYLPTVNFSRDWYPDRRRLGDVLTMGTGSRM